MKRILLCLLLCSFAHAYAERVEPYTAPRIFWDTSTRKTIFSSGSYARLIQLQNGKLLAVVEQGGNIVGSFSDNDGGSWGSQFTIATSYNDINMCVPDLIQLADGRIIVAYNPRPKEPYTEDRLFGIRCRISTDDGSTWSDEIFVNDATYDFYNGCWEPSMIELPSGEIHLYFADEEPYPSTGYGDQQISLCRSFDKGLTWTEAQVVSYRAGYRDGMPVPIISADGSEFIVAIEDNGWGYGDFFPTTVRCSADVDWYDYYVDANSSNRAKALDLDYCPVVTGGAPYLRKLGDDYTVISWQSSYDASVNKMWVGVGDSEARNFKAIGKPFITSSSEATLWNSLAVIDTVVFAIGGVAGSIEMEKGYPKTQFEAALGTPTVDGKSTTGEGYYASNNGQVRLGQLSGTAALCDFAYNIDSLYFIARVTDATQVSSGANQDVVRLCIDTANTSDTKPAEGTYEYQFRLTGNCTRYYGNGSRWRQETTDAVHCATSQARSYYVVEVAIPWSDLGISGIPTNNLAVAIEIENGDGGPTTLEIIPDTDLSAPYTWMSLHLQDVELSVPKVSSSGGTNVTKGVYNLQGQKLSHPVKGVNIVDGKKVIVR